MIRTLFVYGTVLFFAGCERLAFSPVAPTPIRIHEGLIINGFNATDTVIVGMNGFRVGWYYDFSPYDSLRITFSAKRLVLSDAYDHILIRVGPATYFSDSLLALQKDFSILVRPPDLGKSYSDALTFIVPDAEVTLLLSHLRVIGWSRR